MNKNQQKEIIVFLAYYPPHIGGMEFFAHELNLRLCQNGQKITIFVPNFSKTKIIPPDEMAKGITIVDYPAFEIISNFPCPKFWHISFWSRLRDLFRQPFDVTVSHTRFFIASFLALCFARLRHIPLIHIEHGSSSVQSNSSLITFVSSFYDATIGKAVVRGANAVVAISDDVNHFLQKKWGVKSVTIMRGFDIDKISAIPVSQNHNRSSGVIRIMYIGRLISGKGLDILLSALLKLSEKNWELFIIGDGPTRKSLEEEARKLASNKIIFLGKQEPKQAMALLKTADIFINPSLSEGLPTTVAEAALCEKAIIATDVGSTRKLFPESNIFYLVPPNNPDALTEKISKLLKSPTLLERIGRINKDHIINNFPWNKPTQQFLEILEKTSVM